MIRKQLVGYIYKITNKITDEVYIGQTYNDYKKRWKEHIRDGEKGTKKTKLVQSFVKYGIENFEFEVIEEVYGYSGYLLDIKETEYIRQYDSYNKGLNSNNGANGTGHSEIKYIGIIVDKLLNSFSKVEDKINFLVSENDDLWLYRAFLFLDNAENLVSKHNLKIGINKHWNELDITIYNEDGETLAKFYNSMNTFII